jgi:60 kDa SS-A/Ro ribonucleoprotein
MSSSKFVKSMLQEEKKVTKVDPYLSKNELPEETVARILLTGIVKNQFYRSADAIVNEATQVFIERAKIDPEFLLKGACVARNSHMKGMVKVALAALNGNAREEFLSNDTVRAAAIELLKTFHPGQLIQFVELCKSKKFGRGFGARPQKWVRGAMESWSPKKLEDYTLKYPQALNQLVRLVHPRYVDSRSNLIKYVIDGKKNEATGKKQLAVEVMKTFTDKSKIALSMIDNEIPWDVVKGFAGLDGPLALSSLTQMELTALLLNIRSLEEHGAFNTSQGIQALKLKMDEVKNGRSIPLDFAKPYIHCSNSKIQDILLDAMAATLDVNMGNLEGLKVGVSVDISGSMSGETLQTAGLMSVPFLKAKNLWFTTFDTSLYEETCQRNQNKYSYNYGYGTGFGGCCPKISGLSRKEQIKNLLSMRTAGRTDVSISLRQAIQDKRKLDLMVIVTDEQQNSGTPLMKVWKEYKKLVNPEAQLWVVNATNNKWHSADFGDPSVTVYQSITPAIFRNLEYIGQPVSQAVRNFDLKKFVTNG